MTEKRMLIVPAELVKKIDDNRNDMSQSEFLNFLIDSQMKEEQEKQKFVTMDDLHSSEQDIRALLKSFLDFFVSYGLELGGNQSMKTQFTELANKLGLEEDKVAEGAGGEAKIKWK